LRNASERAAFRSDFSEGQSARNASVAAAPAQFPLIVISHANGSFGMQISWLRSALAANGYVAAAVDRPGDNFLTGSTVQGTTLTWLRATDLSRAIDGVLADSRFAARIDTTMETRDAESALPLETLSVALPFLFELTCQVPGNLIAVAASSPAHTSVTAMRHCGARSCRRLEPPLHTFFTFG
jgi:hypothetical protein